MARSLQETGPLPTKLGQVLAAQRDALPEAMRRRLEALYAGQPPMSAAELDRALAEAFSDGLPFARFDRVPLGVGSVGQVHRAARSDDGRAVVVKLLRPGIERAVARDVEAFRAALRLVPRLPGRGREEQGRLLSGALDDLEEGLRAECDLSAEAEALEDFGRRVARRGGVVVPRVHRDLSSPRVLVMDELKGEPLSAYGARVRDDPDAAKSVASRALREILQQVFEDGHFHADPHAGNLLVLEDGRLGLVDLGLTGRFGPQERRSVGKAIKAFMAGDARKVIAALLDLGAPPDDLDREAFAADVLEVVRANAPGVSAHLRGEAGEEDAPGEEPRGPERLVDELFAAARRHGIEIPPATTLLIKSLVTVEGVARSLDPELSLARTALPVILASMRPRWLDRLAFWRRREPSE